MLKLLVFIGLGGGLGSISRYLAQMFIYKYLPGIFPVGTFLVNVTGCLLIGFLYGLHESHSISSEWRFFLITGFCGGYTTFSTFSYESLELLKQGNYLYFFTYVFLSITLGLLAAALGFIIAK